jgi:hypothetical protein
VAVTVATLALGSVQAGNEAQKAQVQKAIAKAPVVELAAKAASLVSAAQAADRADMAIAAVEVIVGKHPAVAPTLVAAIARVAPETAARVAGKAAELSPGQAVQIAKAAAIAAPKQAGEIAVAVAKIAPKSAAHVAQAVMFAVREQSAKVADAIVAAQPQTQGALQPALRRVMRADGPGTEPPPGGNGTTYEFLANGDILVRGFFNGTLVYTYLLPSPHPGPINGLAGPFDLRGIAVNVSDLETEGPDPLRDYAIP